MNVIKLVHLLHPFKYNNYYKRGAKNVTKRTLQIVDYSLAFCQYNIQTQTGVMVPKRAAHAWQRYSSALNTEQTLKHEFVVRCHWLHPWCYMLLCMLLLLSGGDRTIAANKASAFSTNSWPSLM